MAEHRNFSLSKWLQRIFEFKSADRVSNQVGELIVPVVNVEPIIDVVRDVNTTTTGTTTIFTTPTDKDFYLVNVLLSNQSNATADSTEILVQTTLADGSARSILRMPKLTTTAIQDSQFVQYDPPLKLARNVVISVTHTFTVGASTTSAVISGFIVETVSTN